jgi:hypothetical protein
VGELDRFECTPLHATLAARVCIARQLACGKGTADTWRGQGGVFPTCRGCALGATIRAALPLEDGMLWHRADLDKIRARLNGATQNVATEAYVSDALAGITDGTSSITWATNWGDVGSQATQLHRLGKLVILNLFANCTSTGALARVCTLPSGYRPPGTYVKLFWAHDYDAGTYGHGWVEPDGDVHCDLPRTSGHKYAMSAILVAA